MDMFGIDRVIDLFLHYFVVWSFGWFIWIPVGGYVASQKGRSVTEGVLLGLLGPFGAIVEALLPTKLSDDRNRF